MQAVLFEIQLLRAKGSASSVREKDSEVVEMTQAAADESEATTGLVEAGVVAMNRRGSQGLKSILLKGEMRFLKEANMLVFLCSPL